MLLLVVLLAASSFTKGQILFNIGDNRNLLYGGGGYNTSFVNGTIGAARRDYIRILKKEIIGFLDVSMPLSGYYFTKYNFRKGLQFDIFKKGRFRFPITFSSSSILRHNTLFRYDDVTADFSIIPGIYTDKYTFALDLRYELIAYRHVKYSQQYRDNVDVNAKSHWEKPFYNTIKAGVVVGLNLKRFVFYIKTGYEQNPHLNKNYLQWYATAGAGFKCGKKPLRS